MSPWLFKMRCIQHYYSLQKTLLTAVKSFTQLTISTSCLRARVMYSIWNISGVWIPRCYFYWRPSGGYLDELYLAQLTDFTVNCCPGHTPPLFDSFQVKTQNLYKSLNWLWLYLEVLNFLSCILLLLKLEDRTLYGKVEKLKQKIGDFWLSTSWIYLVQRNLRVKVSLAAVPPSLLLLISFLSFPDI